MADRDDNGDDAMPRSLQEALLDAVRPIDPGAERATRMQAKLLARVRAEPSLPTTADLVTVAGDAGDWTETSPGNWVKLLRADEDTVSILVRLEPGTVFPAHSHPADEETLVLEGETRFGDIPLSAGDYHLAPKGTEHGAVTTETGCLLFIRTATQATDPDD